MKNRIFAFFFLALIASRVSFAQEAQVYNEKNAKIKGIKAERYSIDENYDSSEEDGEE